MSWAQHGANLSHQGTMGCATEAYNMKPYCCASCPFQVQNNGLQCEAGAVGDRDPDPEVLL